MLNPNIPTKVTVNALCARAALPDETLVSFGRNTYKTVDGYEPMLIIHLNVLFGNVDVSEHLMPVSKHQAEEISLVEQAVD